MARTYSFRLNSEQVQILSEKFNVDPKSNQLGLRAKAVLTSDVDFSQVKDIPTETKREKIENFVDTTPINEIKEKAKELSMTDLKKILNINTKNRNNKIDQKGLYGEKNLATYITKIKRKGVDINLASEYCAKISLYAKEELLMQEYAERQTI